MGGLPVTRLERRSPTYDVISVINIILIILVIIVIIWIVCHFQVGTSNAIVLY